MRNFETISRQIAPLRLIDEAASGKIFFVEFTKKDGTTRRMTARRSVKKGVKGKGMYYRPLGKGLLSVFDMDKAEFRLINLLNVTKFSANGKQFIIV
jgi:WYL_2, Sm-like SH3 beta-barrel fold